MGAYSITVGQAASAAAMLQGFDFSQVDWNEVRILLSDQGLLTPEVANVINQFESGNFSSLYNGLNFINEIASRYPADMLLADAIEAYSANNYVDYAGSLPASPPPPEMDWGSNWDSISDQLTSFKMKFDQNLEQWKSELGIDNEWLQDTFADFAISKVTGAFFDQAEEYIKGIADKYGATELYDQVQEAKELFYKVKNFHTNVMTDMKDAIEERIDLSEYDRRIKENTGQFIDDLGNISDRAKDAVESIGSGFADWVTKDNGANNFKAQALGASTSDLVSFKLTFSPIQGVFQGTSGNDALVGGSTGNTLNGGAGADLLHGAAGNDKVYGGTGTDRVLGGLGHDILKGDGGRDALLGGSGSDKLWGGSQADTFLFASRQDSNVSKTGRDTILDFSLSGGDRIDLHFIDANTKRAGNQSFKWLGDKDFTGHAGEVRAVKLSSDTFVYGDVNGDKKADFAIHLDDALKLARGDFVL